MLRFSIREVLLLTLTVACLAGWWRYHVNATAERARLAKESRQLNELLGFSETRIYALERLNLLSEQLQTNRADLESLVEDEKSRVESVNARLETENARLRRRLLHHDTQVEMLLERFRNELPGS
jgi:hypothetical protein